VLASKSNGSHVYYASATRCSRVLLRTAEENKGVADVGAALERNDNSDGPKERLVLANVGVDCIQITVEYATRTPPLETFLFSNTDNDWTLVARKPDMLKNN